MIHGNSSSKEVFRNQYDGRIGETFHCIAMDLPGHGGSGDARDPEATYWMPGYADVALELMEKLGIAQYAILGWSLGGHIGLEMIARSDAPTGLMISGSPPFGPTDESVESGFKTNDHMHLAGQRDLTPDEVEAYAHATCGINAPFETFLSEAVARTDGRARELMFSRLTADGTVNQQEAAVASRVPFAIVNGETDQFINNDFIAALPYGDLWEGKVHLLPGIGHAPFWEAPKTFDPILERFLASI
ncbi:alpha/beta fold hydrolase [Histidinibacterium aquaticum]|nr:alpha/beta hydrolase [Histidinibacterium aquaticum]